MKKNLLLLAIFTWLAGISVQAQDVWYQKQSLNGSVRYGATGFTISGKGYIGTGITAHGYAKDFWEYDPVTDVWTQKADFRGSARHRATGFSIGSEGYIGTGFDGKLKKDFWEYDPVKNKWTRVASYGGAARANAVGMSIGGKGYVGTGFIQSGNSKDFWAYDPNTNTWTQNADFGGTARDNATGFSIGSKGYIGTGFDGAARNDFWEYDPATDIWTQKADFGGIARFSATGFAIVNHGYIGTGNTGSWLVNDFWEYNPSADAWQRRGDFAASSNGSAREQATGISINGRGYVGFGTNGGLQNDWWEYSPAFFTITASTGGYGGSISPSGLITLDYGGSQTFTITPNASYKIADVLVDGNSVGAVNSYTFDNVIAPHTIQASFASADKDPNISINSVWVTEGNDGYKKMIFTVAFPHKLSKKVVTVNYHTINGTATAPSDYEAISGILTFAPGERTKDIEIFIYGDYIPEPDETFKVKLTDAVNATIKQAVGIGTIVNDDYPLNLQARQAIKPGKPSVAISPVPASDNITVQLTGFTGNATLQLLTLQGNILKQEKLQTGTSKFNQEEISVADIASGTYLITVFDDKGNRQTKKLVVAR